MKLLIVESPAKAKKIEGFLGKGWYVRASIGHIRDLPGKDTPIPDKYKELPWAKLGVDVDNNYKTIYVPYQDKKKVISELKSLVKEADEVLLATDPDREGESIAWHLEQLLGLKNPKRVTYQEITEDAVRRAIDNPRRIDMGLVAAQEARRILDRLVGYGASPAVIKAMGTGAAGRSHSAGRVQSATLLILAGREHARMAFASAKVYGVRIGLHAEGSDFRAVLTKKGEQIVATTGSFGPDGELKAEAQGALLLSEQMARDIAASLEGSKVTVTGTVTSPLRRSPPAPLTTSGLQKIAGRIKFSSKKTSDTAQKLYEGGHITYIRTDSPVLSDEAVQKGQAVLREMFGPDVLPDKVRKHAAKGNAQEAHEAIRPTKFTAPEQSGLEGDELALYRLIYETTLASLMKDATGEKTKLTLQSGDLTFVTSGSVIHDPGYLRLFNDEEESSEEGSSQLPAVGEGQRLGVTAGEVTTSKSKPPARFTEGTLVAALEKAGIGRPSTFTSTIETLLSRAYIVSVNNQLHVTPMGLVVAGYLQGQLPVMVNRQFTAQMEEQLDQIAEGKLSAVRYLDEVWKGRLGPMIAQATTFAPKVEIPNLPQAYLTSKDGAVQLVERAPDGQPGRRTALHPDVLSEELTEKNLDKLLSGEAITKRGKRVSSSKTSAAKKPRKKASKK